MTDTLLKRSLFEQLAQVSKAMGHANRLMILDVLAQGENDVESLHQKLNLSIANVSKHLQSLKQAGLVKNRRDKQNYTLLDVRPEDEFAAGHLPNAINIPIETLTHNLAALNPQTPVIVYCRGPYCMWSQQAVENLLSQGFNAKRLREGYPEWRSQQSYSISPSIEH